MDLKLVTVVTVGLLDQFIASCKPAMFYLFTLDSASEDEHYRDISIKWFIKDQKDGFHGQMEFSQLFSHK